MSKIPVIKVPLAPIVPKGEKIPVNLKRLRPFHALDLKKMIDHLETSVIKTINIGKAPWSIISVLSPYSNDFHLMLMETAKDRYLPSMEYIKDKEGNSLMKIWIAIVKYMKQYKKGQIYVGYNWSPRSWGEKEEETGFQSIPTKWHGMFWNWQDLKIDTITNQKKKSSNDNDLNQSEYEKYYFINEKETSDSFKGLNGKTKFANDIVNDFKKIMDNIKNQHLDSKVKNGETKTEKGAYIIQFNHKMEDLFESENFFSDFLKPIAKELNSYFTELTDLFFKKPMCEKFNAILKKTSYEMIPQKDYKFLQSLPELKEDHEIISLLSEKGFSDESIEELLNLVKNRYFLEVLLRKDKEMNKSLDEKDLSNDIKEEYKNPLEKKYSDHFIKSWRKGFAYSLTFKEIDSKTLLKISPGAYLGPGGVVEAEGVVLKRPENYNLPEEELIRKSKELHYEFAEKLSKI